MPTRVLLLLALAGALALAGCGEDDQQAAATATATATATPTPAPTEAATCREVDAPKPKPDGKLERPKGSLDPSSSPVAVVTTSCGAFTIALDVARAPKTSASFASLARRKFFDGTVFHRIVPDFVIQGGDPTGTGTGGPGYSVEEAPPSDLTYTRGVVAMAKTGAEPPGTSGSQFYVVTKADAGLPPEYALLGRVTEGYEVVEAIGAVPTGPEDRPVDPVVIESVRIRSG